MGSNGSTGNRHLDEIMDWVVGSSTSEDPSSHRSFTYEGELLDLEPGYERRSPDGTCIILTTARSGKYKGNSFKIQYREDDPSDYTIELRDWI
uniref:Uncharacterized protein n=1 Tax=viral metagenome TaxID=1070528 RepID=A0A6C0JSK5_9ZZZZ